MKMDLKKPCSNCPFRNDIKPYLTFDRAEEILDGLINQQQSFSCHKTNDFIDDDAIETENTQHCAGALILLEKLELPNQWMRIAERIGCYDRHKLKMDSPVYEDEHEMLERFQDAGI